jgi:hypothetical protein
MADLRDRQNVQGRLELANPFYTPSEPSYSPTPLRRLLSERIPKMVGCEWKVQTSTVNSNTLSRWRDAASPLVDFEMSEIQETIRQEWGAEKSSVKHLVTGPANRKRTAIALTLGLFSQWVGNGVFTYYLSLVLDAIGVTNAADQSLINGGLQIFNFAISVFVGALMVDRLGRRVLCL